MYINLTTIWQISETYIIVLSNKQCISRTMINFINAIGLQISKDQINDRFCWRTILFGNVHFLRSIVSFTRNLDGLLLLQNTVYLSVLLYLTVWQCDETPLNTLDRFHLSIAFHTVSCVRSSWGTGINTLIFQLPTLLVRSISHTSLHVVWVF